MKLLLDDKNIWSYQKTPHRVNPVLRDSLIEYLNYLTPIFDKAKSVCEFEFIFTLLRIRGMQGPGWDPYETTEEVFKYITKIIDKEKDYRPHRHLSLWLYGHIFEASELYEILANLLWVINGERFIVNNFPDKQKGKYKTPISPSEKIDRLTQLADKVGLKNNVSFLKSIFNRELRNSIFHSDYSLFNGELRLIKERKIFKNLDFVEIVNKGFAYYMSFSNILRHNIQSYSEPKVIPVHPEFSDDPNETAITIIRKGDGLVGLKDFQRSKSGDEYISYQIGKFTNKDSKLLSKDPLNTLLPSDSRKTINKILKVFPFIIRKHLIRQIEKFYS